MKKLITIILIFGTWITTNGQASEEQNEFEILEKVEYSPPCGYYSFAIRIKVKLTDNSEKINLIIDCPENYGEDFFKKGKLYYGNIIQDFDKNSHRIIVPYDSISRNGYRGSDYLAENIKSN